MLIRDLKISDLMDFEGSNLPKFYDGPFRLVKSIEDDGKLVGIFWVRLTVEASMVLNEDLGKIKRARVINETYKFLYNKVPEQLGISDAFVVFDRGFDPKYIEFLKNNYAFEDVKSLRIRR
jgi:hypothetical protein